MSAVAAATPQADVSSPEAYAARLYERHRRAIYGLCLNQLRSREDADDAVQTTFIYALQSLRRGVVPQMELPWLLTIARNACSTRRRSGSRRGAYESPHDLDSIQDRLATPERADVATSEDFLQALRAIPESQRTALLLREWRGLSYEEIGSELGLSQAATEALLFRARQNVAQRLGQAVGLKPLHGLPLLSFLRNLFQTAAAKTVAVGAGAVLTIAAIPAAEQQRGDVSAPPAAVRVHGGVSGSHAPGVLPSQRAQPPAGRGDVSQRLNRDRVSSHGSGIDAAPNAPVTTPAAARTPSTATPAASSPASSSSDPVTTAVDTVGTVVETASDVAGALNLPAAPLPAVTTPTLPLPVQPPELPSVSLP